MFCYIKEWPNKMATLMTADGVVLCTCETTDEARKVWQDWKQQHLKPFTADATETELEILPYSPTVGDWLKAVVAGCYVRKEKKVVNE
ncbi:MAG: hypothetical protein H6936_13905 [Burkholderiales bacterium]|nr:hypothetical protein [Burkholderiales bacterium]